LLLVVSVAAWVGYSAAASPPPSDPILCNPAWVKFVEQYPHDWEQRVHPKLRAVIAWQRLVGCHAVVIGYADEVGNLKYTAPKVKILIGRWDGTDLFKLGIPRTYNGKPVEIVDIKDFPQFFGVERPNGFLD